MRGLAGERAVAGSVASLGGLKLTLGTDEDGGSVAPGTALKGGTPLDTALAPLGAAPRFSAPRTNFCRGIWGGAGGLALAVFSFTEDVGAGVAGLRFVLIGHGLC